MTKFSQIIGAVTMVAFMSGCATSFEDHENKYSDISLEQLLDAKKLPEAKRTELGASIIERAELAERDGNHRSTAKYAQMALELSPEDNKALSLYAYAQLGLGKLEKAENLFKDLSTSSPSAETSQGYGLTLLAQSKVDEAQKWLNDAVRLDSNLWRSWNGLGVIYDMSKQWTLAEQAFKAGIAVAEHNTTINNNLGLSYLRQKRLTEALIAFENVQALPGGKDISDLNYRTTLALNGEMDKALGGTTDTETANLYNNLGVIAIDDGEPRKAITYLKKAIATSPSYYPNAEKNLEIAKSALP